MTSQPQQQEGQRNWDVFQGGPGEQNAENKSQRGPGREDATATGAGAESRRDEPRHEHQHEQEPADLRNAPHGAEELAGPGQSGAPDFDAAHRHASGTYKVHHHDGAACEGRHDGGHHHDEGEREGCDGHHREGKHVAETGVAAGAATGVGYEVYKHEQGRRHEQGRHGEQGGYDERGRHGDEDRHDGEGRHEGERRHHEKGQLHDQALAQNDGTNAPGGGFHPEGAGAGYGPETGGFGPAGGYPPPGAGVGNGQHAGPRQGAVAPGARPDDGQKVTASNVIGGRLQQAAGTIFGSESLKTKGIEREGRGVANSDSAGQNGQGGPTNRAN